jgi:hypothetical protein
MNNFPYLGSFADCLPIKTILDYANSIPKDKWKYKCSPLDAHTYENRPMHEQEHYIYYGKHNASFKELIVSDKDFFPDSWFYLIKAKKEGYVAKIYCTTPGNFEPPHKDFFPGFLGDTKSDGSLWTQKDIDEQGKKIIRAWIPLMDSKLGHILYGEEHALSTWKAGDVYELPSGEVHGFVNGGREDRYVIVFTSWRT